jgi:trimethylamine--corrinoid protein Co-methyltransferase
MHGDCILHLDNIRRGELVAMFRILSDEDVERIHSGSLEILSDVGIVIHHESALRSLDEAGAIVDHHKQTVRIPPEMTDECTKQSKGLGALAGRSRENDLKVESGRTYTRCASGSIYMIDSENGTRRNATSADVENFTRLQDALENISFCGGSPYPSDVHPSMQDIYQISVMLRNTCKHIRFQPFSGRNLEYAVALAGAVVGGKEELRTRPILSCITAPSSPLRYSREQIDVIVRSGHYGLPVMLGSTPTMGASGPVTLAGSLMLQNAEILAGIVLSQVMNPKTPLSYGPRMPTMDMRTGLSTWGAVEFGLAAAAAVQVGQAYGLEIDTYGPSTDAKVLDEQAGIERAFNAILPALAGAHIINGAGVLESILSVSMEQLAIDNEMLGMMLRLLRGIHVEEETLARDVIRKVGPGGNYLANRHTLKHFKAEHFIPELFDRRTRAAWERAGSKNVVTASKETVSRILAEHHVASLDKGVTAQMDAILDDARKKIT